MKFPKPDGVIEIQSSGCCCPPGPKRKGQHTNSGTSWWRIDSGEWNLIRSMGWALKFADRSATTQEFLDSMTDPK